MSREEAIAYMGPRYVLHPQYKSQENHSAYAHVNLGITFMRVRDRLRNEQNDPKRVRFTARQMKLADGLAELHRSETPEVCHPSLSSAVADVKQRLHAVHKVMAA